MHVKFQLIVIFFFILVIKINEHMSKILVDISTILFTLTVYIYIILILIYFTKQWKDKHFLN